ncbi:Molybdenum cofactor guanylyltransferase [Thalassocella blandensis]|nr:Molybdenum cofactor guanylyltransferase [Thalassocella blandensis]
MMDITEEHNCVTNIPTVILAGGRGTRLGVADKCLATVGNTTILQHQINTLKPQASALFLNVNGDVSRFSRYELPTICDAMFEDAGPLAGIASTLLELQALEVKQMNAGFKPWLITVPSDCPFLPADLVMQLVNAINTTPTDIAYCKSGDRDHFVCGIWSADILPPLLAYLSQGKRSVGEFIFAHDYQVVEFQLSSTGFDPFFNINTPEQLAAAQTYFNDHDQ